MDTRALMKLAQETSWAIYRPALEAAIERLRAEQMVPGPEAARSPTRSGSVAVVPIQGPIRQKGSSGMMDMMFGGRASTDRIGEAIRQLVAAEDVGSIVLDIDSPGGEVYGTPELADTVFQARGAKPIIAVANSTAFSAAYWIGSQASEFVVTPGGEVGSIGVFALHADFSAMDKRVGVEFTYISAGKHKVTANEDEPLSDEGRTLIQADVDRYYSMFVGAVARGRGVKAAEVRGGFGEGWTVGAKEAVSLGMADRVGTLQETIARLAGGGRRAGARAEGEGIVMKSEMTCGNCNEMFVSTAADVGWTDCPKCGAETAAPTGDADLDLRERRARLAGRA